MAYWFTRAASWLAGRVPREVRLRVAGALAVLAYYLWLPKRRVTIANMAQVLGATPESALARRLARNSWRNYGRYATDFLYLGGKGEQARADAVARMRDVSQPPGAFGRIDEARERGKGVIIVTAHFGNWDAAGLLVASHCPLHVVVERFTDPRMDTLIQSQRRALGMEVLWMEKSPRQILRVLQQNGVVAIVADRPLAAGEGVPVSFFGQMCYVPGGVAQLALLSGATILPGFCHYDGRFSPAYYGVVLDPIAPEPSGDRRADTAALTQRIYSALEEMIQAYPDQWYMFRPFWPDAEATASGGEAVRAAAGSAAAGERESAC
jgi:lauroyl/myristoyl acyltransferase